MTIPPTSPGNASREALAARLTELRAEAGLSGNALARRMGIVQSRVWKIEHPDRPPHLVPNEDDITAWAKAVSREDVTGDLLDMLKAASAEQEFSAVFRRKGGPAAYQERVRATEEQATRIGEFEVAVVPGILQTADYARAVLSMPCGPKAWGADDARIEAEVDARLRRQEALHDPSKRIQVVLGEGALRTLVAPQDVLAAQLDKLLSVLRLPSVELGVIAFTQPMPVHPLGFRLYDDGVAVTESIAAEHEYAVEKDPDKVAAFVAAFEALRQAAVTGAEAEAIIQRALDDLRG